MDLKNQLTCCNEEHQNTRVRLWRITIHENPVGKDPSQVKKPFLSLSLPVPHYEPFSLFLLPLSSSCSCLFFLTSSHFVLIFGLLGIANKPMLSSIKYYKEINHPRRRSKVEIHLESKNQSRTSSLPSPVPQIPWESDFVLLPFWFGFTIWFFFSFLRGCEFISLQTEKIWYHKRSKRAKNHQC